MHVGKQSTLYVNQEEATQFRYMWPQAQVLQLHLLKIIEKMEVQAS